MADERLDITEIAGADALYEADGIIAQSEANAASLFGSQRTFYSTEGSSQCLKAMLYLALTGRPAGTPPVIVAAGMCTGPLSMPRHCWILRRYGSGPRSAIPCVPARYHPGSWRRLWLRFRRLRAAVYITSPDYLGGMADIAALAQVCHRRGTVLLVDNAHGAYLHFLKPAMHPLDLGADLCCDSAHKTLPVLTGGAYLHVGKRAPQAFAENGKAALALFGSTSPSYLTLTSLDLCNRYLAGGYGGRLADTAARMEALRGTLRAAGWQTERSDPLRLTLRAPAGITGMELAQRLRQGGVECEICRSGDFWY